MSSLPVAPDTFHVFDTTLRDGAQQEGLRLTVADKLRIAVHLDELGVDFIEGGWPGANPNDTAFFAAAAEGELELHHAELVAFGFTRRVGATAADDPLVQALIDARTPVVCIVAKSHAGHVHRALHTTLEENLGMIRDTVEHLVAAGRRVFVDCEHFFDGYKLNPSYALECVRTAAEAGAEVVVLCDTNGGMLPSQMGDVVTAAGAIGVDLGVHCHNDTGCAVANTLAAVDAGVMHIQGTVNEHGERTGNANIITLIANLQLKYGWSLVPDTALREATRISHAIAGITNVPPNSRQPYVGMSAFAHKAGLHASAIKVDANLYQHIDPTLVGNDMRMLVSDMAGRANIQLKGSELGYDLSDRELAGRITDIVKQREMEGYSYESADASFELLLREELGLGDTHFDVLAWRVLTGHEVKSDGDSEATVKLRVDGTPLAFVADGHGPVNALDLALRTALKQAYPVADDYELTDYRVRILDQGHGTDAIVRVLIDTTDGRRTWTTVGVGTNVIEASWEALVDAYRWGINRFLRDSAADDSAELLEVDYLDAGRQPAGSAAH
ncbi:citramalate synthase [Micropruina sonneratiae]|uniref:citramalate synthase n=1 Tax=Micropruina sonneratiae TaxID=2986940 RepID=UPI002225E299|nr:citramalate synthase [Micropruina sp. KQZ13P-5]MCW3157930.1 citramalate synthase [Micropruina sp. KQZ13P-5]